MEGHLITENPNMPASSSKNGFVLVFAMISAEQWPNLKNLSGGLNLSRGLNIVGST